MGHLGMRLYFLRHAQAEERGRVEDFARELTARGKRRTQNAARVIHRLELDLAAIYSSPRIRARQTADIVAHQLGSSVKIDPAMGDFNWGLASLEGMLAGHAPRDSVMLIGHEPTFSETIEALTGGMVVMKKGGLARVDVYLREPTRGSLVWMIAPRVFDLLVEKVP